MNAMQKKHSKVNQTTINKTVPIQYQRKTKMKKQPSQQLETQDITKKHSINQHTKQTKDGLHSDVELLSPNDWYPRPS